MSDIHFEPKTESGCHGTDRKENAQIRSRRCWMLDPVRRLVSTGGGLLLGGRKRSHVRRCVAFDILGCWPCEVGSMDMRQLQEPSVQQIRYMLPCMQVRAAIEKI